MKAKEGETFIQTVTGESVMAPIAASRQAIVKKIWKLTVSCESSPVRAINSSHTTASAPSPGAAFSAASAASDNTVSRASSVIAPSWSNDSAVSSASSSSTHSRARSASMTSPAGRTATPRNTTTCVTPTDRSSRSQTLPVRSDGQINLRCNTAPPRPSRAHRMRRSPITRKHPLRNKTEQDGNS